jgi:hypothetical protein
LITVELTASPAPLSPALFAFELNGDRRAVLWQAKRCTLGRGEDELTCFEQLMGDSFLNHLV